jgi:hypothetical protein
MKLPNYSQAIIAENKITDYLLSESHPEGKDKAVFFSQFGFSVVLWEQLADALRQHAAEHEVASILATAHGTKYVVEGELSTPSGRKPKIRTVWLIEKQDEIARLITAYPLKEKSP